MDYDDQEISNATHDTLDSILSSSLNLHDDNRDNITIDENKKLIDFVLGNIDRDEESGRLIVPALWKEEIEHLLSPNFNLARSILNSQKRKLSLEKLQEYDAVIQGQLKDGVIEKIGDISAYLKQNPEASVLAHNAVFVKMLILLSVE